MTKVITFRQLSLWDAPEELGAYVETHGAALTFSDLAVGMRLIYDVSTESHQWFRLMEVADIIDTSEGPRAIIAASRKDRRYINKHYVDNGDILLWREA